MEDLLINTYKDEKIKDRKGKKYTIKSSFVYGNVEGNPEYFVKGYVYNSSNQLVGEFIGNNKKVMITNVKNNIDIMVYDM